MVDAPVSAVAFAYSAHVTWELSRNIQRGSVAPRRKILTDERTLKSIAQMRGLGLSMRAAAKLLEVSYSTLKVSFNREPTLRDAWDRGRYLSHAKIRAKIFARAMAGDRRLLIFLAKRYLGMTQDGKRRAKAVHGRSIKSK